MKLDEFLNYVYGHTYPGNIDLVCDGHENPEAYLAPEYANFETYAKETFGEMKRSGISPDQGAPATPPPAAGAASADKKK